jgi:hypothetical protein
MNIHVKNFFEAFRAFLSVSYKYIVFTCLFYSLWLVKACFLEQNFDLHAFSGRMIGIATLQGFDVGARVTLFYKCILVLLCSFVVFNLAGYLISKKYPSLLDGAEVRIINYCSLIGILFFLFEIFGYRTFHTMEMVYLIHKLMLGSIVLTLTFFRKNKLTLYNYTLVILISISFYFFIADCFDLSGQIKNPDFLITTFIICCLLIITINFILKNDFDLNRYIGLNSMAYALVPLGFLPFISVLKAEIFLVCKANDRALSGQGLIYFFLIIVLALIIFARYRKSKKHVLPSQKNLIAHYYFPMLIFSLITYVNYSCYVNYSDEAFEAGNKYLAIMEFKLFGVIPTLEKLNSHLLSDYFFSGIYTLFNGLKDSEMGLYDFLYTSISCVLYYYLIFYISRNAFIAAFCVLLFPFCGLMLPEPYSFGIFAFFALHKTIYQKRALKKYLLFFVTITGLVIWRIDLGYTCLVVMSVLLLYYHFFSKAFKINWHLFFKALIIVFGSAIIILVLLSFYRDVNLFKKTLNALNYFASAQTYGYSSIGQDDTAIFKMHYFVFPIIVAIIIIALLIRFKTLNVSGYQRLSYLALLFICIFYFVNFNRGLIRHSLIEGVDYFTSSFIYIIIPGAVFVFSQHKASIYNYIAFCGIAFFILINYKLPDPKGSKNYLEKCMEKIQLSDRVDLSKMEGRVKNKPPVEINKNTPFIEFIEKNTTANETFIDFSNNPMLYFYTKKITPSYFYQNPLCSHNDFLQNIFLKDLKDYNTPYLIFSRNDILSYDIVDDVPNTLRHYRMAEYFYQNFKPYITAGIFSVWKRNDVPDKNFKDTIYTYKKNLIADSIIKTDFKIRKDKKYFTRIILDKKCHVTLKITSAGMPVTHHLKFVNDTLAYSFIEAKGELCSLELQNDNQHISQFQIIECDNTPDFYSETSLSYDFMWLPHIWGTYDKKIPREQVLFESGALANLDKSTGNTVQIYCRNRSKKVQKILFWFGNMQEKNKTSVTFNVIPSEKEERYAVRVSSIYKWYSDKINGAGITADSTVTISKIQITKGM